MRKNKLEELFAPAADPHAEVEMMHITQYLKSKGCSLAQLAKLPEAEAKALMEAASQYASLRLTELEMGAAFVNVLHHDETMTPITAAVLSPIE